MKTGIKKAPPEGGAEGAICCVISSRVRLSLLACHRYKL